MNTILRVKELMKIGNAARSGVSNDIFSVSQIPSAYQQSPLAFDVSSIDNRVVQFAEIPRQQLPQHFTGEAFIRVLSAWAQ